MGRSGLLQATQAFGRAIFSMRNFGIYVLFRSFVLISIRSTDASCPSNPIDRDVTVSRRMKKERNTRKSNNDVLRVNVSAIFSTHTSLTPFHNFFFPHALKRFLPLFPVGINFKIINIEMKNRFHVIATREKMSPFPFHCDLWSICFQLIIFLLLFFLAFLDHCEMR